MEDASPDRWGRTLILRQTRAELKRRKQPARTLTALDYLLGVNDESRLGALRLCQERSVPRVQRRTSSFAPAELARAAGMDPTGGSGAEGAYLLRYLPEGAVIRITESAPERQIQSARSAARRAREQLGGAKVAGAVVFDCICRNLILGDAFGQAIAEMTRALGHVPLAGFETYGEIALAAGDMSGFHNTTTVVLAFPA